MDTTNLIRYSIYDDRLSTEYIKKNHLGLYGQIDSAFVYVILQRFDE